jgi:hypothetical protein
MLLVAPVSCTNRFRFTAAWPPDGFLRLAICWSTPFTVWLFSPTSITTDTGTR